MKKFSGVVVNKKFYCLRLLIPKSSHSWLMP